MACETCGKRICLRYGSRAPNAPCGIGSHSYDLCIILPVVVVLLPIMTAWWLLTAGWRDSGEADAALSDLRLQELWAGGWVSPTISEDGKIWTWPTECCDDH